MLNPTRSPKHRPRSVAAIALLLALLPLAIARGAPLAHADDMIELEQRAQAWTAMVVQGKIVGHLRGQLELQTTVDLGDSTLDRVFINTSLGYALGHHVTFWSGYAAVASLNGLVDGSPSWEHRVWQGLQHEKDFGGVIVINRSRIEERVLSHADEIGLRVRHLLRAVVPLEDQRLWAVVFSDEVFFNLNSPSGGTTPSKPAGFDQNRAFVGVSWRASPHLAIEGGYLNNFSHQTAEKPERLNHVAILILNTLF